MFSNHGMSVSTVGKGPVNMLFGKVKLCRDVRDEKEEGSWPVRAHPAIPK
jgi:hypothetical protein